MTISIQQAIDTIIAEALGATVPTAPPRDTVDTIKIGDSAQPLTGIVTTFLATVEVIEHANQLGANLIITHEPIFYNHRDETDWLTDKPVYEAKCRLIEQHGLVIWRFHDLLHTLRPDPTVAGLLDELEWIACAQPEQLHRCRIPPMTLRQLAEWVKTRLSIETLRVVGDPDMTCRGIALLPGCPGRNAQIGTLAQSEIDVVITGEISEWETSEYVRDATRLGQGKGLLVLGHAASEEPGMRWVTPWLQARLPGIAIRFVPTGKLFHWV
jgi:putative NIF3 family GTP cyclohydrolase 1 type 2